MFVGMTDREAPGTVRLDKWLWAARFYKTRALAVDAIDGDKVDVNGNGAKRAKAVRVGDRIQFRQPPYEWDVEVRGLSERRGPASVAVTLYEETGESRAAREIMALRMKSLPPPLFLEKGKPDKKQRREIERFKRGES
jgi:ribosome-associated heat shock protein Hsp15